MMGEAIGIIVLLLLALTILYAAGRLAVVEYDRWYFRRYGPATCSRCHTRAPYAFGDNGSVTRLRCTCGAGAPRRATKWA